MLRQGFAARFFAKLTPFLTLERNLLSFTVKNCGLARDISGSSMRMCIKTV